jgi:hypothetical protein
MIFYRLLERIRWATDCSCAPRNPIIQLLAAAAATAAAVNDRGSAVAIGVNNMSASLSRVWARIRHIERWGQKAASSGHHLSLAASVWSKPQRMPVFVEKKQCTQ